MSVTLMRLPVTIPSLMFLDKYIPRSSERLSGRRGGGGWKAERARESLSRRYQKRFTQDYEELSVIERERQRGIKEENEKKKKKYRKIYILVAPRRIKTPRLSLTCVGRNTRTVTLSSARCSAGLRRSRAEIMQRACTVAPSARRRCGYSINARVKKKKKRAGELAPGYFVYRK